MQGKGGLNPMGAQPLSYLSANSTNISFPRNTGAENNYPTPAKVFVPLLLSFTAGTGSIMTARSIARLPQWLYTPQIHIEPSARKQVDTRSPAEHVANIRAKYRAKTLKPLENRHCVALG
jgi:hypothetical protein